ncbi:HIT family protein [[Acholeplasma] multilocale]|uniref:HIT family protein n=1 Tax=[Acholeplasma] multilocale TaxID=264638 RepID=UPI00041D8251|nr:HIT family protein [[Acholeplasma] multilocale]
MDCLFCKIINQEIPSYKIFENEYTYAFLDINPVANGHTLVIPKKHFEDYSSTDDFYLAEVAKTKKIVANLLVEKLGAKGFNYVANEKEISGQIVFHYHDHIVPKYEIGKGYMHSNNRVDIEELENVFANIKK